MGVVEASSGEAALNLLQSYGLVITLLELAEEKPFYAKEISFFSRVSQKDVVIFSRQLSLMFKSRIPLVQVLQTLAEQTPKPAFRDKILAMAQTVEGGVPLSKALERYPAIFSPFYINLVKSGEASGTLSESLDYLADHMEREYFLLSKVRAAMIYPVVVLVVVIIVLAVMSYYIIPQLSKILLDMAEGELPTLTKVVIGLSSFIRSWGWILFLGFIGIFFLFFRYIRTPAGRKSWDRTILRIPLLNNLLRMFYVSRFAENLSTLIKGGLPISRALEITSDTVSNEVYREIIIEVRNDVRRGESISRLLRANPVFFPPMVTQMVIVGEKTGTLEQSLTSVVRFYRGEIERTTDAFLKLLEPILIIFMSLIVGVLAAGIFIPLYQIPTWF